MMSAFDLIARAVVLLSLAWLGTSLLRRRSAALRAFIWTSALAASLVLPALWVTLPALPIPGMQPAIAPTVVVSAPPRTLSSEPAMAAVRENIVLSAERFSAPIEPALLTVNNPRARDWTLPVLVVLFAVSVTLGVRLIRSHVALARIARRAVPAGDEWTALVGELRSSLGMTRPIPARLTGETNVPAVAGVWRSVLLLPIDAAHWPLEVRRTVVVHELAHVARWDGLGQLIGHAACAVYWFVPLAWYGARRAGALRERASDDAVLRAGVRASSYADSLIALARASSGVRFEPAALGMARTSRIRERVTAILDPAMKRDAPGARASAMVALVSCAMLAMVATIRFETIAQAQSPVARTLNVIDPIDAAAAAATQSASRPDRRANVVPAAPAESSGEPVVPVVPELPAATDATVTPADPVAPVSSVVPPVQSAQPAFRICEGDPRSSSRSIRETDNRPSWTMKLSGDGCEVNLNAQGRFEFNADFTDLIRIDDGGFFRVDVTDRGSRRQLDIAPQAGSLRHVWRVDGREQPYDAAARAWFASFLIELDRRTGIGVDVRLPMLMRQGGLDAVLKEAELLPNDYVRSLYLIGTSRSGKLSPADTARVLRLAIARTKSDHYLVDVLKAHAAGGVDDASVRGAILDLISRLGSDHYRTEAAGLFVKSGTPSPADWDVFLKIVPQAQSDHYRVEMLTMALRSGRLLPAQHAAMARSAATIESDHYVTEFLKALARAGLGDAAARQAFDDAVGTIQSGHYVAELLRATTSSSPTSGEVASAIRLSRPLSDHYRADVLRMLVAARVSEPDLLSITDAAKSMQSEHYKAEVLRQIARHAAATERVRSAVLDAASAMSRHYADQVRQAIGR